MHFRILYRCRSVDDHAIMHVSDILQERRIALQLDLPANLHKVGIAKNSLQEDRQPCFSDTSHLSDEGGIIKFHLHFINVDQMDLMLLKMNKVGGDPFPIDLGQKLESWEQTQGNISLTKVILRKVITVRSLKDQLLGRSGWKNSHKEVFRSAYFCHTKKEGVIV